MVAWRELCKGILVETLRFVVAAWGETKHPGSCKQADIESSWVCSDQRDYWEAQARKCRERLAEAELTILELEAYRSRLFWIDSFLLCLCILVSFVAGGLACSLSFAWRRRRAAKTESGLLSLEAQGGEALVAPPKDVKELAAARLRARGLRG